MMQLLYVFFWKCKEIKFPQWDTFLLQLFDYQQQSSYKFGDKTHLIVVKLYRLIEDVAAGNILVAWFIDYMDVPPG